GADADSGPDTAQVFPSFLRSLRRRTTRRGSAAAMQALDGCLAFFDNWYSTEEIGAACRGLQQQAMIVAGEHHPHTHPDIAAGPLLIVDAAHREYFTVSSARLCHLPINVLHPIVADLPRDAHLQREIVGAYEQSVDPFDGRNRLGVFNGFWGFAHLGEQKVPVVDTLPLHSGGGAGRELCEWPAGAAMAHGM